MTSLRQTPEKYQTVQHDENASRILAVRIGAEEFRATGTTAQNFATGLEFHEMAPSTENGRNVWISPAEQTVWRIDARNTNQNGARA